jgi:hypothetical protein
MKKLVSTEYTRGYPFSIAIVADLSPCSRPLE